MTATPASHPPKDRLTGTDILVIVVLVATAFVMMLNETSLSVALPSIMATFDVTAATAQWLLTGVMLTMAIILPTTGWMLDRFTTRQVYLFAVGIFIVGTILAAVSPTFSVLLLARVLQAVGTAAIVPLLMTVVMTVVPPKRRGTIMGVIAVVMAVGPALGPSFAGLVMSFADWHWVFLILVPFLFIAAAIGAWKLPNIGDIKLTPLDVLSVVLSVFAFGGLIYGLSSIGVIIDGGPAATVAIAASVVGLVGLVLFIWRQLALAKHGTALLNLTPLKVWNYSIALASLLLLQAALLGVVNTLPLFMQGALLVSVLVAGTVNLPGGIVETIASPIGGWLFDRIGARPLAVPGSILMAVGLFWMSTLDEHSPVRLVMVQFVVLSLGLAIAFTPLMTTALGALPQDLYSHGSAIFNTLLQLAGAAGTAIMIAVYSYFSETGGGTPAAQAEGGTMAFLVSAWLCVAAAVITLFLRKPDEQRQPTTIESVLPA